MFERISLMLGRLMTVSLADLKREEGQGATEYAMVIAFVIVGLTITLGVLGTSIQNFLKEVGLAIDGLL
jgi:Flp pilus assembly pilin Flp